MWTNNFEYIPFVLLLMLSIICCLVMLIFIRYKHIQKICQINVLRRQQLHDESFFVSAFLQKTIKKLFFCSSKKNRTALCNLCAGRVAKAVEIIEEHDRTSALFLLAHQNFRKAYNQLKKNTKLWQSKPEYVVYFALMCEEDLDYKKAQTALNHLNIKKLPKIYKAYYCLAAVNQYLQEGDLLSASQNASFAMKQFQKYNFLPEEAKSYLCLAQIYKISCVNDVAKTMIESAINIYKKRNLPLFLAKAEAIKGMQFLFENRFDAAKEQFLQALEYTKQPKIKAEILNQLALTQMCAQMPDDLEFAQKAYIVHCQKKNVYGQALSLQLMGHIYNNRKKFATAIKNFKAAQKLYSKQKNFSAFCECLYTHAGILYQQKKYMQCEKLLRLILDTARQNPNNFHHANAYSLLGLIYMHTGDLQRAKVLFQQSLNLEQKNSRNQGIAVDYADLAIVEKLRGNEKSAEQNLQAALEYAKQTQDEQLIQLICKKVQN